MRTGASSGGKLSLCKLGKVRFEYVRWGEVTRLLEALYAGAECCAELVRT